MDLQKMEAIWERHDAKLEHLLKINRELVKERKLSKARWTLRRFAIFPMLDLVVALAAVGWFGTIVGDYWPDPRMVVPAGLLLLASNLFLVATVYDLSLVALIDYGSSVADSQHKLEQLKINRVRTIKWVFLLAPLMGFAILLVAARTLLGFDVIDNFSPAWVVANVLFGVAFVPSGAWFSGWLARRFPESNFLNSLSADVSGRSLESATRFLDELARFQ